MAEAEFSKVYTNNFKRIVNNVFLMKQHANEKFYCRVMQRTFFFMVMALRAKDAAFQDFTRWKRVY